jgi:hypothetical protein
MGREGLVRGRSSLGRGVGVSTSTPVERCWGFYGQERSCTQRGHGNDVGVGVGQGTLRWIIFDAFRSF